MCGVFSCVCGKEGLSCHLIFLLLVSINVKWYQFVLLANVEISKHCELNKYFHTYICYIHIPSKHFDVGQYFSKSLQVIERLLQCIERYLLKHEILYALESNETNNLYQLFKQTALLSLVAICLVSRQIKV